MHRVHLEPKVPRVSRANPEQPDVRALPDPLVRPVQPDPLVQLVLLVRPGQRDLRGNREFVDRSVQLVPRGRPDLQVLRVSPVRRDHREFKGSRGRED